MTEQTYTVTSERLSGFEWGQTVTADDLPGCNMAALVASGHLEPRTVETYSEEHTEED